MTIVVVPSATPITDTSYSPVAVTRESAQYRPAPVEETPNPRPLTTESWAYLIAAKNGTIWLARDYRVRDGVLEFSTTANSRKHLPLADVDRALTEQLNREQGVAVQLP